MEWGNLPNNREEYQSLTYFSTPVEDRFFADYRPGSVHEFGKITIAAEAIVAFAKQFDPQFFHTDPASAKKRSTR